jgi:HD-like signal output (HDOD) protein
VRNQRVIEIDTGREDLPDSRLFECGYFSQLPDVPVMTKTILLMELKVREQAVDLREISKLLLSDVGAALQVFRLAGREYESAADRPNRIEDCISDLGLQACLEAVSRQTVGSGARKRAICNAWDHAKTIADYCRQCAEDTLATIHPEQAYLVGLFHELGYLPALLGWDQNGHGSSDSVFVGQQLAEEWALPSCVREIFLEMRIPESMKRWSEVIDMAHNLANMPSIEPAFGNGFLPHSTTAAWI